MDKKEEELIPLREIIGNLVHETLLKAVDSDKGNEPFSFEDRQRDVWMFERLRNLALATEGVDNWRKALEFAKWLFVGRVYFHRPKSEEAREWAYIECQDEIVGVDEGWNLRIERRLMLHKPAEYIRFDVKRLLSEDEKEKIAAQRAGIEDDEL